MATSRKTTQAAPAEGQRFTLPHQRKFVRIGRAKLANKIEQSTYVVQDGVPTLVERVPMPRQPITIGSIVRIKSLRRHYLRNPVPGLRFQGHWTHKFDGVSFYVVREISPDMSKIVVVPLAQGHFGLTLNAQGQIAPMYYGPNFFDRDRGIYRYRKHEETVGNERREIDAVTTIFSDASYDDWTNCYLANTRAITGVFSATDIEPRFLKSMQAYATAALTRSMYEHLAELAPNAIYSSRTTRNIQVEGLIKRTGDHVRHYLKRIEQNHRLGTDYYDDTNRALRYLRDGISNSEWRRDHTSHPLHGTSIDIRATEALRRWCNKRNIPMVRQYSCGHWGVDRESEEIMIDRYGSMGHVCPDCESNASTIVDNYGAEVRATPQVASGCYTWSDNTLRLQREPGVIGGRHSGKGVVGYVSPLVKRNDEFLTLGLELEMQAYNGADRDVMARAMKTKLQDSGLLTSTGLRKYLHFEEDGSTGPGGFEMVTGHTDLATHAQLLRALLCKDNGGNAYAGKLRSHDASGQSCGIHVHAARPKSLLHAMKISYFINAGFNEQLIRDVARRYGNSYCTIREVPDANKAAAERFKRSKDYLSRHGYSNSAIASDAIGKINEQTRYVAVNYQNRATVEFRIFRGSMVYETVMACLEFSNAVWHFAKEMPATKLNTTEFIHWINEASNRKETRNLRTYLRKKGYDTIVPKARKEAPTTTVEADDTATA